MTELVRVSCSSQAYAVIEGKVTSVYKLSAFLKKGKLKLNTFGGVNQFQLPQIDKKRLLDDFRAVEEDPSKNELRLQMPYEFVDRFVEWYQSGESRERVPFRELEEELGPQEYALLENPRQEITNITPAFGLTKHTEKFLATDDGKRQMTHYFFEVFTLGLSDVARDAFRQADGLDPDKEDPKSLVRLVSFKEAGSERMYRPGRLDHGASVGDMFKMFHAYEAGFREMHPLHE